VASASVRLILTTAVGFHLDVFFVCEFVCFVHARSFVRSFIWSFVRSLIYSLVRLSVFSHIFSLSIFANPWQFSFLKSGDVTSSHINNIYQ